MINQVSMIVYHDLWWCLVIYDSMTVKVNLLFFVDVCHDLFFVDIDDLYSTAFAKNLWQAAAKKMR